jgi:hypothetical protein
MPTDVELPPGYELVKTIYRHTDPDADKWEVKTGHGCPIVNVYDADTTTGTVTVAVMISSTLLALDVRGNLVLATFRPLGGVVIEPREQAT